MAKKACHAVASTTQVGLTKVLAPSPHRTAPVLKTSGRPLVMTTKLDRLSLEVVVLDDGQYSQARGISIIFRLAIAVVGIALSVFALILQVYSILPVSILFTLAGVGAGHTSFMLTLCKMFGTARQVMIGADGLWLYGTPKIAWLDIEEVDCSFALWLTELELKNGNSIFLACPGREAGPHLARYLEFRRALARIHAATTLPARGGLTVP